MSAYFDPALTFGATTDLHIFYLRIFGYPNILPAMEINEYASLFKSLSEPVRLRVLYLLLQKGELCVCDIVDALELSQSVVSRHLAYLRNGGLLNTRREGVWVYYDIAADNPFVGQLLNLFKSDGNHSKALTYDLERLDAVGRETCN